MLERLIKLELCEMEIADSYGETGTSSNEALDNALSSKPIRTRKRMERSHHGNNGILPSTMTDYTLHNNNNNNNNNNNVKNERLSPSTPDTSSRSRSVTPNPSASHPDTPPTTDIPFIAARNYSDIMRTLAAKYNRPNPNDYFSVARNSLPLPLDSRFKPFPPPLLPALTASPVPKESDVATKKPDFTSALHPFAGAASIFPPPIDMSATQTLVAMMRGAKEVDLQGLLRSMKQTDTSPLDLSSATTAAATTTIGPLPAKRPRIKTPSIGSPRSVEALTPSSLLSKRPDSESPKLQDDISSWSVEDVSNFVGSIDICAEYAQNFREQRIDGSGLPLLTEEHLTDKIGMKLGPALKLRSILAKKIGNCNLCMHCSHCHGGAAADCAGNTAINNASDAGETS